MRLAGIRPGAGKGSSANLGKRDRDEVIFAISQEELKGMENLFLLCEERELPPASS